MAEFNRSAFKGATLNSIKDEQGRAEKALPKNDNFGNRPGFHTIEDGKNWRRIAPAHDPSQPAYRAKSSIFLECEVPELDKDGKETGKKELKRKNIFIATQHSKTLKDDPITMYISFVNKRAQDEIQDKDERQKFLAPISGWRGKDGKWNWGIRPGVEYICYAWNEKGELAREQLYPQMLDAMKKISVERCDDQSEIIPDVFTDPDEGYPLIITKAKNDKGKYEMTVSCELPGKKETWTEFFQRTRLTDEQMLDFVSKESLSEIYEDSYSTRDFNMAVDGLRRFDEQYKYHIFDNEEFVDRLTALKKLVPEFKPKDEDGIFEDSKEIKKEKEVAAKAEVPAPKKETGITSPSTPIPAMKRILKEYIAENYGADYALPDLSKEDLVEWYNLAQAGDELPFDDAAESDTQAPETQPEAPAPKVTDAAAEPSPELADQIAKLRSRRTGGKSS